MSVSGWGKSPDGRRKQFQLSLFVIIFLVLLLMSGLHVGIVVFMNSFEWNTFVQIILPLVYWAVVALCLTRYTGWRIKEAYEKPMHQLAKATSEVAHGDFSVFIPTTQTTDKQDYVDIMIMDFNKMVEALGSIETLKTDFFSNVSHEIKTPLAVIQNNAELLQKVQITDQQRQECTDTILHATKRLSNLITSMLKLNKLEKQVIKPIPENYDVCEQLCECALQFEEVWDSKGIEFVADIEDCANIVADKELLALAWTNLLSNAIKFTPRGGTVTLTQTSEADGVIVSVSDTGCGMDAKTVKHIFDKFYQGDASHSTEGNGLGLALVQRVLQLTESSITVESTPGSGSTFTVRLPISLETGEDSL